MDRFEILLEGFVAGTLSAPELREFMGALEENEPLLAQNIMADLQANAYAGLTTAEQREKILSAIHLQKNDRKQLAVVRKMKPWKWVAAASVIILLGFAPYFVFLRNTGDRTVAQQPVKTQNDIPPGHDGAILTLADGKTIVLDNAPDGKIADGAVKIGNQVSYENNTSAEVQYNTITTPKGRQFSLVLPDGTQVWLNAASSLTYPTAFTGNERRVTLTGEGYFKVTHDATQPFIVNASHIEVHDLGTEFNINAYGDEPVIQATLVSGLAELKNGTGAVKLQPGKAAMVQGSSTTVTNANVEAVTAWKNGLFHFEDASIQTIMRQVARWYDVDVKFEGAVPTVRFSGEIGRGLSLKEFLSILDETRIHYSIDDGHLIITP